MLPDTAKLDYAVLYEVVQSGHSRVPVYKEVDVPDLVNAGKVRLLRNRTFVECWSHLRWLSFTEDRPSGSKRFSGSCSSRTAFFSTPKVSC